MPPRRGSPVATHFFNGTIFHLPWPLGAWVSKDSAGSPRSSRLAGPLSPADRAQSARAIAEGTGEELAHSEHAALAERSLSWRRLQPRRGGAAARKFPLQPRPPRGWQRTHGCVRRVLLPLGGPEEGPHARAMGQRAESRGRGAGKRGGRGKREGGEGVAQVSFRLSWDITEMEPSKVHSHLYNNLNIL